MSDTLQLTIRLAFRNIFRNTRRTGLMILLVASGLTAMIFTDGLMLGMSDLMVRKITGTWMGDAQVHQPGFREGMDAAIYIKDPGAAEAILAKDPAIKAWSKRTIAGGMVASSNNVAPSAIFGVDPRSEGKVSRLKEALVEGEFLKPGDMSGIMIGHKMAELLEVRLGDRIVTTMSEAETGELSQLLFRVSGILNFNDRMMDKEMAFVSLEAGQTMAGIGTGIHEIVIAFNPVPQGEPGPVHLTEAFAALDLEYLDWQGLMPELSGILRMTDYSSLIIGGVLFILVSLGLINSMFMSIYERHYEFGVMLSVGTRRRALFSLICWEGSLLGIFGALFGVVFGMIVNYWMSQNGISFGEIEMSGISLNEPMKAIIRPLQFTVLPLFVIALSALACIIPAIHGARLVPAIALRRAL